MGGIREMYMGFSKEKGRRKLVKVVITCALFALFITGVVFASYSEDVNEGLADSLIRLHVLANSDSKEDQQLKRDVRDRVIQYMKEQLKDSKDIEQTKNIINKNLNRIEEISREVITKQNKKYPVKAMLGSFPFPTKLYGDIALPAGYYQALRVVIGEGEGANWWCVLFPPLCFVDATHGTVPDSVKQDLKATLSNEEYALITAEDTEEDIPVKVKFKVVELFQNSRIKFTGMVSRIFK
ncbi:MAG: stage II sporulation protein R [Clostridia bacterium]|nr:stage II sporulation protein R [Clostridia bacterium]